jgi:hypothetical protein
MDTNVNWWDSLYDDVIGGFKSWFEYDTTKSYIESQQASNNAYNEYLEQYVYTTQQQQQKAAQSSQTLLMLGLVGVGALVVMKVL